MSDMRLHNLDKLYHTDYIRHCYSIMHLQGGLDILAILNDVFVQRAYSYSAECGFTPAWVVGQLKLSPDHRLAV